MNKLSGWDDTIVAIATAPGLAAIAVIRLSGPQAIQIANTLFPSKDLAAQPSHTLHVGMLKDEGILLDEVVISIYHNPKSFTGEDVVEISTHGSPHIQEEVVRACVRHGARIARAGEFTQRAFLHGKMDLTQAEAVADLIASNSAASRQAALHNIRGGFAADLKNMREQLVQFAALIELELDFATEDVEFADRTQLRLLLTQVQERSQQLIDSFKLGNVIKHGVSVAIIGKPNAGKSTLLNALLNEERAIVSEIAGTTRDSIEETLNIRGVLFRLIDTAGIRSHSTDLIENIGIERSLDKMRTADVVIYLFDVRTESAEALQAQVHIFESENIRYLLAGNKADAAPGVLPGFEKMPVHFISAKQKTGIPQLQDALFDFTMQQLPAAEGTIITNARHFEALTQLQQALTDVQLALDTGIPGDLISLDLRRCLYFLGEITGEISNEDKLDYIFSKFCIGK